MEVMTFNIDKDRRNLVDDKQNFNIDFHDSKYNWLEARQYEESMRQVEVHVVHGNGSPVDLTGVNPVFEGWLPEGVYRIIDAKHSVMIDAQNGIFRFDFPAPAFQIAGSYKQAFFRLMKDGKSVTTLEFSLDVMADKVISGLVPSDYITPFEDEYDKLTAIVENADSKFSEQLIEWKNQFNKIIGDLNGDYISIKSLADALDARLKTLEEKIKADGLLTQAEFDAAINLLTAQVESSLTKLDTKFQVNSDADIGGDRVDSAMDTFTKQIDDTRLNIAVITDSHYADRYVDENQKVDYPFAKYSLTHLPNFLELANHVDLAIALGDNTNGYSKERLRSYGDESLYADRLMLTSVKGDVAIIPGNHDDASPANVNAPENILLEQDFKNILKTDQQRFGEIRNGDSLYFYKDYKDKKVRVIVLWSEDVPDTVTTVDGSLQYPRWLWHGYRQDQLNWLANTALKVPSGYQTVIMAHAPLSADGWIDDDANAHYVNNDLVCGIINAFVQGTNFSGDNNEQNVGIGWGASVSTDFSTQGPQPLVGFFDGHKHREKIDSHSHFKQIELLNDVCLKSTDVGTSSEGAMTVISIDTANRRADLLGWGRATDRTISY